MGCFNVFCRGNAEKGNFFGSIMLLMGMLRLLMFLTGMGWLSGAAAQDKAMAVPEFRQFADLAPRLRPDNDTVYVINFWATWCKPCVRELPYFQELEDAFAHFPVKVLLVSLDMRKDLPTRLPQFLTERNIRQEVLALTDTDANAWIPRVHSSWSGAIPATLFRRGSRELFLEDEVEAMADLKVRVEALLNETEFNH